MLSHGLTYPALIEMLKGVFVEVAQRELEGAGTRLTDSRISLMTGVHRKDVRRLRGQGDIAAAAPVSLGAQVVALWSGLPEFTDAAGHPRPLPRLASKGAEQSFEALAARVNTDIRSRSILDELVRLGIVQVDHEDRVVLLTEAFVPQKGSEERLSYFGHNLYAHAAAAAANVVGTGGPWLERSVHYSDIAPGAVEELHELATETGMQAIQAVNRKAMTVQTGDTPESGPAQRIIFGVYFYAEPVPPSESAPPGEDSQP
jgi:hypothetical protein